MAKVLFILCHQGLQLILASMWERPAILVARREWRGNVFISSVSLLFIPVPLSLFCCPSLSSPLLSLLSFLPFSGR